MGKYNNIKDVSHSKYTVFHKQLQCFKLKYLLNTGILKETKTNLQMATIFACI